MADDNATPEENKEETAAPAEEQKEEAKETPAEEKKEDAKAAAPAKADKAPSADLPELSSNGQKVLDLVEKLTVLELAAVVKHMEDKFGVSAAAPVAVAAAGGAAGGEAAAAKDTFDVILTSGGQAKINVIKVVREITGLGLKEAKDLVDGAPKAVKEGVKEAEAQEIKKKLEDAGAEVEVK